MKNVFLLIILNLALPGKSQDIFPSNTYVRTCLNDVECSSINSSSYLFYDAAKGKFYVMIDFNRLKTGIDSVDFWLEDLSGTNYYFKASLPPDQLPGMSNYNPKTIKLTGQGYLNGIWKSQTIDVSLLKADNDMMSNSINPDSFEAIRVNLNFSLVP